MLINLLKVMRQKLSELTTLQVPHASCEFETPPRVLFVNDMATKKVVVHYRNLKEVQLSEAEKVCVANCLETNKNNPNFYNGYVLLLKDVVYDSATNVLYVEALRCRYAVVYFLNEDRIHYMPELQKQGLFTTGALVPMITIDNFTALLQRKDGTYSVVAGFAEPIVKNSNHLTRLRRPTLPLLYERTAEEEALEELLWDKALESRTPFKRHGISGITMLRGPNGTSICDFIVPVYLKCDSAKFANILQTNCAPDAKEHSKNFEMVPLAADKRAQATAVLQKNLAGDFVYKPILASAARVANPGNRVPRYLPGDKQSVIFSVNALVPKLERPVRSAEQDLLALGDERVQKLIAPQ